MNHPQFYKNTFKGSHIEIIMQLCDVFKYVIEVRGSLSTSYFHDNVKHRFCFVTKEPGVFAVFFDNGAEALNADKHFNAKKYEV